jgi:CspA family cold shock protein
MHARVKWFDNTRGWGFLVLDDGREVFVHHTAIEPKAGFRALCANEPVECDLREDERGLHATGVRPRPL